ncbi:hypothetical protein KY362_04925 [Candidatus Woesearchaeota archaeon]|nr:hypothetical protein [Candidatus Woesearchaeota archaeon]
MQPNYMLIAVLLIVIGLTGFALVQYSETYDPDMSEEGREPVLKVKPPKFPKAEKQTAPETETAEEREDVDEEEPGSAASAAPASSSDEDRAVEVAKDYLDSLSGFRDQRGRKVEVQSVAGMGCDGCWLVRLTFIRDRLYYPEDEEHITVNLKMEDWKVETYTFG